MSIELTVTIKDSDRTLKRDFLIYEDVTLVDHDPIIMKCINETVEEFKGEPDYVRIKAIMVFK